MSFIVSDVRDAVASIKAVLSKAEDAFALYHFEDGQLKATNRNMRAGVPVMFTESMCLRAGEFEKALKVMRKDPDVLVGPNNVVFKSGKTRLTLPKMSSEFSVSVEDIEGTEVDVDDEFLRRLKLITPILEDSDTLDWMNSVICVNGKMITVRKAKFMLAVDYEPFAEEEVKCLLPPDAVKFLLTKKGAPSELIVNKNAAQFKYDDDSWVVTGLFGGKVPGRLFTLLDQKPDPEHAWDPTDEHREVISDCLKLGARRVLFTEEGVTAELTSGEMDVHSGDVFFDVQFPVKEGQKSRWDAKDLDVALSVGKTFDFTSTENCIFTGDDLTGLIAPMVV